MSTRNFTAVIKKENGGYVANSPEAGISSYGPTIEQALGNLKDEVSRIMDGASLLEEDRPLVTTFGVMDNEEQPRLKTFTGKQLLESGIVGMWADRTDIGDSVEFARKLRREAEAFADDNLEPASAPIPMTGAAILASPLWGLWKDRDDIGDSVEFAHELRNRAETRVRD